MNKTLIIIIGAALATLCATTPAQSAEPTVGQPVAVLEATYLPRRADELQRRIQSLGAIVSGKELKLDERSQLLLKPRDNAWVAAFADAPQWLVKSLPQVDELRILDAEGSRDLDPVNPIGQDEALKIAGRTLAQLARAGFIDARQYDLKRAEIGYHRVSGGSMQSEKPAVERITEYRITLRPAFNGIEFANSGVRIGVHASGRLIGLRIGGATINSQAKDGFDLPIGEGHYLLRKRSDEELNKAFSASILAGADAKLHWSKLMYAMPDGVQHAVVAPTRIYAYSPVYPSDDGATVVARRKLIGLSIVDGNEAIDYTPASRVVVEEKRGR